MTDPRYAGEISPVPLVLIVAWHNVHTARWLNLIRHAPFRVVLFPSVVTQNRDIELEATRTVSNRSDTQALRPGEIGIFDPALIESVAASAVEHTRYYFSNHIVGTPETATSPASLVGAIKSLQPDILHSQELQHSSYLCLEACRRMGEDFPPWIASNWGSDIYLYRKFPEHRPILRELFQQLDALHSDCIRDFSTAEELGFNGTRFAPAVPGVGGADLKTFPDFNGLLPPSKRKLILVKGYHGWAGRGLHILSALHRVAPALSGYRIVVHLNGSQAMARMAEALTREDGLDIALDPYYPDSSKALVRLAQARMVIGYGISDGISTTLLEAMTVGTFCIQADTSCGCEWITPGVTGMVVPPHDIAALGDAIVKAAMDDALVDDAVAPNRETILRRWDAEVVKPIVIQSYQEILDKVAAKHA